MVEILGLLVFIGHSKIRKMQMRPLWRSYGILLNTEGGSVQESCFWKIYSKISWTGKLWGIVLSSQVTLMRIYGLTY